MSDGHLLDARCSAPQPPPVRGAAPARDDRPGRSSTCWSARCPHRTRSPTSRCRDRPTRAAATRCSSSSRTGRSPSAGSPARDDGAPLLAHGGRPSRSSLPLAEVLGRIPDVPIRLAGRPLRRRRRRLRRARSGGSSPRRSAPGSGANFVIKRSFVADITDYRPASRADVLPPAAANASPARTGRSSCTPATGTFVGATPERHVSLHDGVAVMNPISGTYRYPPTGPDARRACWTFLADRKETDELYMVVDEELKMMARICDGRRPGGRPVPQGDGPARAHRVLHRGPHHAATCASILRETMFAPTVTGSPLESACRVISRHEPDGRGYYSGVVALIGRDADGGRDAGLGDPHPHRRHRRRRPAAHRRRRHPRPPLRPGVGGRRDPGEGRRSAAPRWTSAGRGPVRRPARGAVARWPAATTTSPASGSPTREARPPARRSSPAGRVLVVDAEDTFTAMIAHQLRVARPDGDRAPVRRAVRPATATTWS